VQAARATGKNVRILLTEAEYAAFTGDDPTLGADDAAKLAEALTDSKLTDEQKAAVAASVKHEEQKLGAKLRAEASERAAEKRVDDLVDGIAGAAQRQATAARKIVTRAFKELARENKELKQQAAPKPKPKPEPKVSREAKKHAEELLIAEEFARLTKRIGEPPLPSEEVDAFVRQTRALDALAKPPKPPKQHGPDGIEEL
jgi:hypothetical protein